MKKFLLVLLLFSTAGIVNAAVTDDFNSYADGTLLRTTPNWYGGSSSSRAVVAGMGPDGSNAVGSSGTVFTLSKGPMRDQNHVKWTTLAVGDYMTLSMDFQAHDDGLGGGIFDDDRLGMMTDHDSTSSGRVFGAQLEGTQITGYWDGISQLDRRPVIVNSLNGLIADAWYTFEVTITKLGDLAATIDVSLTAVGGGLIRSGTVADTSALKGQAAPNAKYFTDDQLTSGDTSGLTMGGLWPAFKNQGAYVDNFSFNLVPEPTTIILLGLGGLALLRRRRA